MQPLRPDQANPGLERTRHQLRASGTKDETENPLRSGIHTRGYLPHVKTRGRVVLRDVSPGRFVAQDSVVEL